MSDQFIIEGKKFISSRRAAQACSYTQDYVGQLIRDGKVEATKVGRLWFVSEASILSYQMTAERNPTLLSQLKPRSESQFVPKPQVNKAISDERAINSPKVFLEKLLKYDADERGLMPQLKKETSVSKKVAPEPERTVSPVILKPKVEKEVTAVAKTGFSFSKKVVALAMLSLLVLGGYNFVEPKNFDFAFKSLSSLGRKISNFSSEVAAGIKSATETGSPVFSSNDLVAAVSSTGVSAEGVLESSALGVYEFLNPLFKKSWTLVFGNNETKVDVAQAPSESTLNSAKEKLANIGKTEKTATSTGKVPISTFVVSGTDENTETAESYSEQPQVVVQNFNSYEPSSAPVQSSSLQYSFSSRQIADLVSLDFNQRFDLLQNSVQSDLITVNSRIDSLLQNIRGTADQLSRRTSSGGGGTTIINNSVDTSDLTLTNPTLAGTVTVTGATTFSNGVDFANITFVNATGTNATTTTLYIDGVVRGAGLSSCSGASDKLIWNSTTGLFSCGTDAGAGGGITALRGEYSSNQSGAGQIFATSSDTNIGLTITSASDIHTFTPTWTGTLSASRGGTGIANPSAAGILLGSYAGGTYQQIATSSLGLLTTDVAEGSNLYYTPTRVQTFLDTLNKGYFYSTTSADYWLTQQTLSSFSTTSANNYASLFSAFTVQGNGYLAPTTTRGLIVNASSTIGDGTQAGGLTINGGATTTGTTTLATNGGNVGIGATPQATFDVLEGLFVVDSNLGRAGVGVNSLSSWGTSELVVSNAWQGAGATMIAFENTGSSENFRIGLFADDFSITDDTESIKYLSILPSGNVGVATSSPFATLSVGGSAYIGGNLTATGTASTTNLAITSITGSTQCLQVNSLGQVSGTGTACGAGSGSWATTSSDYYASQFRDWSVVSGTLRPSTTIGLIVSASSTIGNGTQGGGLTINGGATTTGSSYMRGALEIDSVGSFPLYVAGSSDGSNYAVATFQDNYNFNGSPVARINLSGEWTSSELVTDFAAIVGGKNNAVDGNSDGYFAILTRTDSVGSLERLRVTPTGNVGIGTSTPWEKLSIQGNILASGNIAGANLVATGTASTTNLAITSITGSTQCLQVNSLGQVSGSGSTCGTGSGSWATSSSDYYASNFSAFTVQGNGYLAPTTTRGLIVNASSTIGSLTITNSTSTYSTSTNLYTSGQTILAGVSGNVGIGTTSPSTRFSIADPLDSRSGITSNGMYLKYMYQGDTRYELSANGYVDFNLQADGANMDGGVLKLGTSGSGSYISGGGSGNGRIFFYTPASVASPVMGLVGSNVGIGTTSPFEKLSVAGSAYIGGNLTATGTASTTNLIISSAGGIGTRCLQVDASGNVSANASACGSGSGSWATSSSDYYASNFSAFTVQGNGYLAPTTTRGLIVNASSTIGNGTLGLTINGPATTTGRAYFGGSVGIGTQAPTGKLEVVNETGGTTASNYLQITGSTANNSNYPGLVLKGGTLVSNSNYPEIALSNGGLALDVVGGENGSGERLTMGFNSTYGILFAKRNSGTPTYYQKITTSGDVLMTNSTDITETALGKLDVRTSTDANVVAIATSYNGGSRTYIGSDASSNQYVRAQNSLDLRLGVNASDYITIKSTGLVGIGENSPGSRLSISGNASVGSSYDNIAAPTDGMIVQGNLGVATSSPFATLSVGGSAYIGGNLTATGTASTTNLAITSITGSTQCLQVNSLGQVSGSGSACGSGSGSWATTSSDYYSSQFRDWSVVSGTLRPSTTIGMIVNASSTIVNLTAVNATTTNSTTTGNAYFASRVGIASTSPYHTLSINSNGFGDIAVLVQGGTIQQAVGYKFVSVNAEDGATGFATNMDGGSGANIFGIENILNLDQGNVAAGVKNTISQSATDGASYGIDTSITNSSDNSFGGAAYGMRNYIDATNSDGLQQVGYGTWTRINTYASGNDVAYGNYVEANGVGGTLYGTYVDLSGNGSATKYSGIFLGGNFGIATTSPFEQLSIGGSAYIGGNLTATGTASTTNLAITSISGSTQCLQVNSLGQVSGTGTACGAGSGSWATTSQDYYASQFNAFTVQGNGFLAPTTTRGLIVNASSTIGSGLAAGGLTINGNATTTGNSYFAGNVAVGGTTSPYARLDITNVGTSSPIIILRDASGDISLEMRAPTTSRNSTLIGLNAGFSHTTAQKNVALGNSALYTNTTGGENVAIGYFSQRLNVGGISNVAIGTQSLEDNITGNSNVAIGTQSLLNNTSATSSIAIGHLAASGLADYYNQGGVYIGYRAGRLAESNSDYNTLVGYQAGYNIGTGSNNIWIGGATSSNAVANLTTGSQNILIGNNISLPSATANGQLNIGNIIYGTGITGTESNISSGNIGIASTSPWAKLSIGSHNGAVAKPLFAIASSSTGVATTTVFSVSGAGSVGIGTASPVSKLHVSGGDLTMDSYYSIAFGANTSGVYINGVENDHLTFGTNGASRIIVDYAGAIDFKNEGGVNQMSITTGGNIGIASTSPWGLLSINANRVTGPQFVVGSSTKTDFIVTNAGNVGVGTVSPQRKLHVYTTADEAPVRFEDANGYCEMNPTTTTWTCTSDRLLKKDIQNIATDETLERMAQLQAVSFKWNKEDASDSLRYGFIAQDVEAVFPELVTTGSNGLKSVAYGGFTPFIIEGIKSLNLSVKNLENRMQGIEGRLAALEAYAEANGFSGVDASTTTDEFASTTASTTVALVSGWLESLGAKIESTIATFVSIIAESLTANIAYIKTVEADTIETKTLKVGDIDNLAKSGVTVLDRSSGLPTCIYMEAGIMRTEPGECGSFVPTPAIPPNNDDGEGDTGTTTPEVVDNGGDTGAGGTTTPPVIEDEPVPPVDDEPVDEASGDDVPVVEPPAEEPPVVEPAPAPEVPAETP